MARSKNGQAISAARRTSEELFKLTVLLETSRAAGDLGRKAAQTQANRHALVGEHR